MNEFNVLEQVQDFKPMRKPYDRKNAIFKDMFKKYDISCVENIRDYLLSESIY